MTADRDRGLFSAVVSVAAGLELHSTLRRIIQAAADLVQARYGALGVLGSDGIEQFVTVGMDTATVSGLGSPPSGRGVLGVLINHPLPLRIDDLTQSADAVGFPPGHPVMRSFLGVPLVVRGEVFGNLYLTEKIGGGTFTDEDERTVVALGAAAAAAIENARLFERTRRREQWQQVVSDMGNCVLAGGSVTDAASVLVHRARDLLTAQGALLLLPHELSGTSPSAFTIVMADGQGDDVELTMHAALADDVLRSAWERGSPERRPSHLIGGDLLRPGRQQAPGPVVAIPLQAPERRVGLLVLWRATEQFREDALRTIEPIMNQAAVTLILAQSQQEQERLTVFVERDRIARDLHDLVIQRLFATGLLLQGALRRTDVSNGTPEWNERVTHAIDELDVTVREIRQTIFDLQDPQVLRFSIRDRIVAEVDQSVAILGARPRLHFLGMFASDSAAGSSDSVERDQISDLLGDHIIAALREALTNIARHAQAQVVDVTVEWSSSSMMLEVLDDGVGISSTDSGRRSGLANLHARAEELGGSCTIGPRESASGTCLRWVVPLS